MESPLASAGCTCPGPSWLHSPGSTLILEAQAAYTLIGQSGGNFERAVVASAGDVDGDGLDDLLLGEKADGVDARRAWRTSCWPRTSSSVPWVQTWILGRRRARC